MCQGWRDNRKKQRWVEIALPYADFFAKVATIAALVAAAGWAIGTFVLFRSHNENVSLSVTTTQLPYKGNLRLLVIHVRPKNLGKVLGRPEFYRLKVSELPTDFTAGRVINRSTLNSSISLNLLRHYPNGYELEPGVEYDDVEIIVIPKGTIVLVSAEIGNNEDDDQESSVDAHAVVRID